MAHRRVAAVLALSVVLGCTGEMAGGETPDAGPIADGGTEGTDAWAPAVDAGRGDAGAGDASIAPDAGPHEPHPSLAALPPNTALDLGRYECAERLPQIPDRCRTITDYSRLNYDPYNHRVLLFGGGHAATGRTDVDVLDLDTLEWSSLYESMSCEEVAAGDLDPRGFHASTGHPAARHTYDQNVIAEVDGVGRMLMLSTEGFAGTCHDYNAPMRGIPFLELEAGNTTWQYSDEFTLPWAYAGAAEYDPVSGMVIDLGARRGAGEGGMWVIDPATLEVVTFVDEVQYSGYDNNLVFYPPTGVMYYIARGDQQSVWEVTLDRDDWAASRSAEVTTTGTSPAGTTGYAYDPHHRLIGGGVQDGRFFVYDPETAEWSSRVMNVMSDEGATPGRQRAHHVDYDPVNRVYIFIADGPEGRRTWAYRYGEE